MVHDADVAKTFGYPPFSLGSNIVSSDEAPFCEGCDHILHKNALPARIDGGDKWRSLRR
jgi:hypothetical protein